MSELDNFGKLRPGVLKDTWLAWLVTAAALLPLFSFFLDRFSATERTLGFVSSALIFFTACAAGKRAAGGLMRSPLLCGVLCAASLVLPLLLCGFLIDRSSFSSDSILSLVSMSFAGALFGSVILGGHGKPMRRHTRLDPRGRKRKR